MESRTTITENRARFGQELKQNLATVISTARFLIASDAAVQRLLEDVAVQAQRRWDGRTGRDFHRWLMELLIDRALNRYGAWLAAPTGDTSDDDDVAFAHERLLDKHDADTLLRDLRDRIDREDIREATLALPYPLRIVVALVFVTDLGYADIAGILGLPASVVRNRLRRGRSLLVRGLEERLISEKTLDATG